MFSQVSQLLLSLKHQLVLMENFTITLLQHSDRSDRVLVNHRLILTQEKRHVTSSTIVLKQVTFTSI